MISLKVHSVRTGKVPESTNNRALSVTLAKTATVDWVMAWLDTAF